VRILDGQTLIATHPRSYDRRQQIEIPEHIATWWRDKHQASAYRGTDQLVQAVPASRDLLTGAVERGEPLGRTVRALAELLERYGVAELTAAIETPCGVGCRIPMPCAWRWNDAGKRRQNRHRWLCLPEHLKRRDVPVRPTAG
jgi:hypothetical protein